MYGYCRISTPQQSIERQIRNILREYPEANIRTEVYTGTKVQGRKEWIKLKKLLKRNDTVVFDSVSRMSRNAEEGFALYEELFNGGVELVFLKEHHIDTATYRKALMAQISMTGTMADLILEGVNKYLMALAKEQIRLAFEQSQKEVDDLRQRTKEGIETARLNGKQIGGAVGAKYNTKKSAKAKEFMQKRAKDFGGHLKDIECIQILEITPNTYYKYKRELIEELKKQEVEQCNK